MNNHSMNNFMTAQAPMSSMMALPGAVGQQQQQQQQQLPQNASSAAGLGGASDALAGLQGMAGLPGNNMGNLGNMNGVGGLGPGNNNGGGMAGLPNDLDQLQQAYNRTGDRGSQHHPIAEFLYQLTKMLTDDNSEIIEWVDGRIKVHYPERLEGEVLHKYFRHSKFASFQRQLNYFGFRKIAGKGKMSPCSYVNEAATSDIRSLLLIKRKTNGSAARKAAMAQRSMQLPPGVSHDLRANLSALAAGAAAATGGPQVNLLNSQAFNAAALFGQQAAAAQGAAGMGQFSLQQKGLGSNLFLNNENAMSFLMSGQKPPSAENLLQQQQQLNKTSSAPTIEQLHAQLAASLASRQQQNGLNAQAASQFNPAAMGSMGFASAAMNNAMNNAMGAAGGGGAASAALAAAAGNNSLGGMGNAGGLGGGPASAAMNATAALNNLQQQQNAGGAAGGGGGPASAALNAAGGGAGNALFESATNLKSLVDNQQQAAAAAAGAGGGQQLGASVASQQLLNARLPSSNTLFPDSLSTASFGNLLASSNRLSSLLSLNSFLSRDPSVADLMGVLPQGAQQQFAASQAAAAAAGMQNNNVPRFQ